MGATSSSAQGSDQTRPPARAKRRRAPAPCPNCDRALTIELLEDPDPRCPECDQALVPARVAGFWRRAVATALDGSLLLVTAGPLALGLNWIMGALPLAGDATGIDALLQVLAQDLGPVFRRFIPFVVMATLYFGLFWGLMGRTLGQRVMNVRVVDGHGLTPHPLVGGMRGLVSLLAMMPAGLGAFWALFDREKRALHDHLTGTWVIEVPPAPRKVSP